MSSTKEENNKFLSNNIKKEVGKGSNPNTTVEANKATIDEKVKKLEKFMTELTENNSQECDLIVLKFMKNKLNNDTKSNKNTFADEAINILDKIFEIKQELLEISTAISDIKNNRMSIESKIKIEKDIQKSNSDIMKTLSKNDESYLTHKRKCAASVIDEKKYRDDLKSSGFLDQINAKEQLYDEKFALLQELEEQIKDYNR